MLVRNSIMHSGIELPRLHLTVSAKARRNRQIGDKHIDRVITICYKDNGCGVDEERKQEIFLRFKSTHPEGTGLGLVIARDNIEKQDGIIAEVGIPGKGVCFTITLPAAERTRESRHVR